MEIESQKFFYYLLCLLSHQDRISLRKCEKRRISVFRRIYCVPALSPISLFPCVIVDIMSLLLVADYSFSNNAASICSIQTKFQKYPASSTRNGECEVIILDDSTFARPTKRKREAEVEVASDSIHDSDVEFMKHCNKAYYIRRQGRDMRRAI